MKRKTLPLTLLLCLCMVLSAATFFTACKKNENCEHAYSEWATTQEPTCIAEGLKTRICSKCKSVDAQKIAATGEHSLTAKAEVPSDCVNYGTLAHDECSGCGKKFINGVEKTDEQLKIAELVDCSFVEVAKVNPTCTQNGKLAHLKCEVCGKKVIKDVEYSDEQLVIPAAHNFETVKAKPQTCYDNGYVEYDVCRACNELYINGVKKTLADTVVTAAHNFTAKAEVPATCVSEGLAAHDYCSGCGKYCIDEVEQNYFDLVIEKTEHAFGDIIPATQTQRAHYVCSGCNKNFNEGKEEITTLDFLAGHTLEWQTEISATCEEPGTRAHYLCTDEGCGKRFYANYEEYGNAYPLNSHPYDAYECTQTQHRQKCTACGKLDTYYSHTFVYKNVCRNGFWYKYGKCSVCDYETNATTYDVPYKLEITHPFIVGRHTLNYVYDSDYYVKVYHNLGERFDTLYKMLPANSPFYAQLEEFEALVKAGNVSSFPQTKTFTIKYEQYEQEVDITFDIEREYVKFNYPVYAKGNISSLNDMGVVFGTNFYEYFREQYETEYVKLNDSRITIIDDGGFNANADCTEGITYTVKFSFNDKQYEASFAYIDKERVIQRIYSIATETCVGYNPDVDLRCKNGSNSISDFSQLEIIDGEFDKNTPGVYTVTFTTIEGYAEPYTVTITVRDKKDVFAIYNQTCYMAKGAKGFYVTAEYFDGTTGKEWIPVDTVVESLDKKFDANLVDSYQVKATIGTASKFVGLIVYDGSQRIVDNVYMPIRSDQTLVWDTDETGNAIFDLSGLYMQVFYNDGSRELVQITEDMVQVMTIRMNEFSVNVAYLGKPAGWFRATAFDDSPITYDLSQMLEDGKFMYVKSESAYRYATIKTEVGSGELAAEYTMYLTSNNAPDNFVRICTLTTDMLYDAYSGDIEPIDLTNLPAYQFDDKLDIVYKEKYVDTASLLVYNNTTNPILMVIKGTIGGTTMPIVGGSEQVVIDQLKTFTYLFYGVTLKFDDFTLGDLSDIDFTKYDRLNIPVKYNNFTAYIDVQLTPNFDLYTSKTYVESRYGATYELLSNGYGREFSAYGELIGAGTFEYLNEEKTLILLADYVYLLNDDAGTMDGYRLEGVEGATKIGDFGLAAPPIPFVVYKKGDLYFAETFTRYYDGSEYVLQYYGTMLVDYDAEKKTISILGITYLIGNYDEELGYTLLFISVSGKTEYEFLNSTSEKLLFNDNGVMYILTTIDGEWTCVDLYFWKLSEDETKIEVYYEPDYYYQIDEILVSDLTKVNGSTGNNTEGNNTESPE